MSTHRENSESAVAWRIDVGGEKMRLGREFSRAAAVGRKACPVRDRSSRARALRVCAVRARGGTHREGRCTDGTA